MRLLLLRQIFGYLTQRTGSLEKTLMLGKTENRRRRGWQRMRRLDGITDLMVSVLWFGCFMRCPLSRKTKAGRTDSQSLLGWPPWFALGWGLSRAMRHSVLKWEILGKLGELASLITHVRKPLVENLNLPGDGANCLRCSNCRPRAMGLFKKYSIEEFYVYSQNVRGRCGEIILPPYVQHLPHFQHPLQTQHLWQKMNLPWHSITTQSP